MKAILHTLLLAGGIVAASTASAATYQLCSTSGCRTGGSAFVWTSYAKTKYPIVLAHGIMGFTSVAGLVEYFYGIAPDLTANGGNVFDTQVSSLDSSYVRGEQLRSQVQQILAITGASKVNLIGHSQGAMDSRYVAGVIPNQIATVTSVGGVNAGTPVADAVGKALGIPVVSSVLAATAALTDAFFAMVDVASGHYYDQNSLAAVNQLTTESAVTFNAQFPAGIPTTACGQGVQKAANGVSYFSWGGTSPLTNVLDPLDYVFTPSSFIISGPSDGMVPQCSQHLGTVLRDDYSQNHGDEVNQVLGLVNVFAANPVTIYRDHANRLKNLGF